jgi:hypothetical protein
VDELPETEVAGARTTLIAEPVVTVTVDVIPDLTAVGGLVSVTRTA